MQLSNYHYMKKYFISILLIVIFNSTIYSQNAKPNKVGQFGDFVGIVTFGGMGHGQKSFTLYSEDLGTEVYFSSGRGIKNPPNIDYGRFYNLINDNIFYYQFLPYVIRVKAKSVLQEGHGGGNQLVWTPTKITLISTSSTLPK